MLTWKELNDQFRKLNDPYDRVRLGIKWGTSGEYLHISGYPSKEDKQKFVALASLAGKKLRTQLKPDTEIHRYILEESNPALLWYKAIWMFSLTVKYGNIAFHETGSGDDGARVYTGSVPRVYMTSANLSLKCLSVLGEPAPDSTIEKPGPWKRLREFIRLKPRLFGSSEEMQRIVCHNKGKSDQ